MTVLAAVVALWHRGLAQHGADTHPDHLGLWWSSGSCAESLAGCANGFYSYATVAWYGLALRESPVIHGLFWSLAAASTVVLCAAGLALRAGPAASAATAWVLVLLPGIGRYAFTGGPDMLPVFLFSLSLAVGWGWLSGSKASPGLAGLFAWGVLLGSAGAFRTHAWAAAGLLLLATGLTRVLSPRACLCAALGVASTWLPQLLVNVSAGVSPLHSTQAFNLWKTAHPDVNWFHLREWDESVSTVVLGSRRALARGWLENLTTLVWLPIVAWAVSLSGRPRPYRPAFALFSTLYVAITALGDAGRAGLLLLPITVATALMALARSGTPARGGRLRSIACPAIAIAAVALVGHPQREAQHARAADFRAASSWATQHSLATRIQSSTQVFSTSFELVADGLAPGPVLTPGGWTDIPGAVVRPALQPLCTSSLSCLLSDLYRRGIRVLWLTETARLLHPHLGGLGENLRTGSVRSECLVPLAVTPQLQIVALRCDVEAPSATQ